MSNRRSNLWAEALPPESLPVYPAFRLTEASGGEMTWVANPLIKIGVETLQHEAQPGELLRDADLKFIPDLRENLMFRLEVRHTTETMPQTRAAQEIFCKSSLLYFVNVFCWTFDPRLPQPHIPFVTFPAQDELLEWAVWLLAVHEDGLVEKSRDMGATWCTAALVAWLILFYPGIVCYLTSLREEDVDNRSVDSLLGKVRYILNAVPEWMRGGWSERGEAVDVHMNLKIPKTQGYVRGQKTESTAGRSGRGTIVIADEFAHVTEGPQVLEAFSSLAQTILYVSTPRGNGNEFARMAHDPRIKKKRLHWQLHPMKNPEWARKERAKPRYTEEIWAQEQDIAYEQSTIGRVFSQFVSSPMPDVPWVHVKTPKDGSYFAYDPSFDVYTGMDFGFSDPTAIVFMQIKEPPFGLRHITDKMLLFFAEFEDRQFGIWETRHYLNARPYKYRMHVGDMRTGRQVDSEGRTWISRFQEKVEAPRFSQKYRKLITVSEIGAPILVNGKYNTEMAPVETLRALLNTPGAVAISEQGCPHLIRAMQNWSFPVDPKTRMPRTEQNPNHDQWSHICKAAVYLTDFLKSPKQESRARTREQPWKFQTQRRRMI